MSLERLHANEKQQYRSKSTQEVLISFQIHMKKITVIIHNCIHDITVG